MVKMNKEYSDAFGFRLLGKFTSFLAEYPAEANQIQKICDDGFKATCMKCYPIIVSTGIDPTTYTPKTQSEDAKSIKDQLREMFPLKKTNQPIVLDESTSSCDEEESECVVVKTNIVTQPRIPPTAAKKIESGLKCSECGDKDKRLTTLQDMYTKKVDETNSLCDAINKLTKELETERAKTVKLTAELEVEKKRSEHRGQLWQNLMKDPEYQAFVDFRKFESFKRKRT